MVIFTKLCFCAQKANYSGNCRRWGIDYFMLNFQKITESDFAKLDAYYKEYAPYIYTGTHRICDYAPGTVKMWHRAYDMEYAIREDNLYLSAAFAEDASRSYLYPLGPKEEVALRRLREHIEELGRGRLSVIPSERTDQVLECFQKGNFAQGGLHADRDWADYVYDKKDFENPAGRKHHRQKNLINRFVRENPEFGCEAIDEKNAPEVVRYFQRYALENSATSSIDGPEFAAVCRVLRAWDIYGMCGVILRTAGEICGFTIGEVYKDTVFVHVEKADKKRDGAFQVLSRDFQRSIDGALFVNREEDMGLEGLRRSKLSYGPIRLDYKYTMEVSYAKKPDISRETPIF